MKHFTLKDLTDGQIIVEDLNSIGNQINFEGKIFSLSKEYKNESIYIDKDSTELIVTQYYDIDYDVERNMNYDM